MLSNAYFVAKFRFDTDENEPAKNVQNFEKCILKKLPGGHELPLRAQDLLLQAAPLRAHGPGRPARHAAHGVRLRAHHRRRLLEQADVDPLRISGTSPFYIKIF